MSSCSPQMIVCLWEIFFSFASALIFCHALAGVISAESDNLGDVEDHAMIEYDELQKAYSPIPTLQAVFGLEVGCSLLKIIGSLTLLLGILTGAVEMMRIWLKVKIITTIICIGLNVTSYVAPFIKREVAIFQTCVIVAGIYFLCAIWALAEQKHGPIIARNVMPQSVVPLVWQVKPFASIRQKLRPPTAGNKDDDGTETAGMEINYI